jgi:hypothetical protein
MSSSISANGNKLIDQEEHMANTNKLKGRKQLWNKTDNCDQILLRIIKKRQIDLLHKQRS